MQLMLSLSGHSLAYRRWYLVQSMQILYQSASIDFVSLELEVPPSLQRARAMGVTV